MTDHKETDYKDSLFLPTTDFPMRGNLPQREPEWLSRWQKLDLYQSLKDKNKGRPIFSYHDGPPYANGHIHAGHAISKVLRDVVVRSQAMGGKDVRFVPGWDCHGLPIEWKIEEKYRKDKKDKDEVPILQFREECRQFARHWSDVQSSEFQRLGVVADWKHPYRTMEFDSEAAIYEELTKFVLDGSLYRGLRSVMWSVVEKTALADAEVEYHDKTSDTVYVAFPVKTASRPELEGAQVVIWTTTTWTLPANRAVAYGKDINYVVLEVTETGETARAKPGQKLVVAAALLEDTLTAADITGHKVVGQVKGADLSGSICAHPLADMGYDFDVPLLEGHFVTTDTGTGFVHVAPSHGEDDFALGQASGLEIPETVDEGGLYTDAVPGFVGQHVFKAHAPVSEAIAERGLLVATGKLTHSYPHSWRSKAPLIFRATPQWFISMDTTKLRDTALQAIKETRWIPTKGENRIRAMVENRPDWCISRQRAWGVPIAIFVHKKTHEVLRDKAVLQRVVDAFNAEGADAWYSSDPSRFLGDAYNADEYEQIMDVVDVWFESGATHAFVLDKREDQSWPADLYLEGSDQHRGWFQSSLLESCGTRGKAPYKAVLTHGFVNDEKGYKMSKSLGNVVSPLDLIATYGADVLRLWAMSVDWKEDMRIGDNIMKQTSDAYRRFRNTFRFILGNLAGYDAEREELAYEDLPELEQWVLHRLTDLDALLQAANENYDFLPLVNELYLFCHQDLSAFYFDLCKDTLYCDGVDSRRRRACRTVLAHLFDCLTRWLAPILSFTAEEAWMTRMGEESSVHLQDFPTLPTSWRNAALAQKWEDVRNIRRVITGALEVKRADKTIGSSLQAQVDVYVTPDQQALLQNLELDTLTITSAATLHTSTAPEDSFQMSEIPGVSVIVTPAAGEKCQRCWRILPEVSQNSENICQRCTDVVSNAQHQQQKVG